MGLRVIVVPLINFCSNSKDQVVDSIIIKHLAVEATPTSEVEGMLPPPPINKKCIEQIVNISPCHGLDRQLHRPDVYNVDQTAGVATHARTMPVIIVLVPTASGAMSRFTAIVIGFVLEVLLAIPMMVVFLFLALALNQVANSTVVDH
jgi:hypothetical protein